MSAADSHRRALEAKVLNAALRFAGAWPDDLQYFEKNNGTLMTEGWLEALKQYNVGVGVSIDGNRTDHDRFRLDHQGRSSFDQTETAIRRLVSESAACATLKPGTISVVDWRVDYAETYRYLRGLGIDCFQGFLFGSPQMKEVFS